MKTKIFILTAVHNNLDDTIQLLNSIYKQTYKFYEVYIIDDGSTDNTELYISQHFPKVKLFKGSGNLWWAGSLNLGLKEILKQAGTKDLVWIINNDCVFSKETLQNLYNFYNSKGNRKIIGSLVIDSKTKKIWDCGIIIDWRKCNFSSVDYKNLDKNEIDALSTKGTLYPIKVFRELGIFDQEHFPHYFSDYEYAIRAKNFGYKLLVCLDSKIYNKIERTGIGNKISNRLGFLELFYILSSNKSKVNLRLYINMIRYVCPKEYRLRNYLLMVSKMVKYLTS
jgi:GT2 family glycosyltransferase